LQFPGCGGGTLLLETEELELLEDSLDPDYPPEPELLPLLSLLLLLLGEEELDDEEEDDDEDELELLDDPPGEPVSAIMNAGFN
jgi:hypothetical protein